MASLGWGGESVLKNVVVKTNETPDDEGLSGAGDSGEVERAADAV